MTKEILKIHSSFLATIHHAQYASSEIQHVWGLLPRNCIDDQIYQVGKTPSNSFATYLNLGLCCFVEFGWLKMFPL